MLTDIYFWSAHDERLIPYKDINECDEFDTNGNSPCDPLATCENLPGNYTCTCPDGYQGDCIVFLTSQIGVLKRIFASGNGFYCIDVNECYQRGTCPDSVSKCVNSEGSYECECIDGYAKGNVRLKLK